jgi:hypothetical protein
VKIYASTCSGTPDNIIFGGKTIGKYTLPKIPNKKYIGQVFLKNQKSIPKGVLGAKVLNGTFSHNSTLFSSNMEYNAVKVNSEASTFGYGINRYLKVKNLGNLSFYHYIKERCIKEK